MEKSEERVVGGSLRADGTVRKAIRIRPGFVPEGDKVRYDASRARERVADRRTNSSERRQPGSRPDNSLSGINQILARNNQISERSKIDSTKFDTTDLEKNTKHKNIVNELSENKDTVVETETIPLQKSSGKSGQAKDLTTENDLVVGLSSVSLEDPKPTSQSQQKSNANKNKRNTKKKYTLDDLENGLI